MTTYNISDGSISGLAAWVGDAQVQTATLTIDIGSLTQVDSATDLWVSGDQTKVIRIAGAGAGGGILITTIATVVNARSIILTDPAGTALSGVSTSLEWGTNNYSQFNATRAWGTEQTQQSPSSKLDIVIDNGVYLCQGFPDFINDGETQTGIQYATINCNGATFIDPLVVGGNAQVENSLHHALFYTAPPGATSIQLKPGSEISRFSVGQWIVLTADQLQGGEGSPTTHAIFEYRKITDITDGDTLHFADPLVNTYKDTLPLYFDSVAANLPYYYFQGGPATAYALWPTFENDIEWINLNVRCTTIDGSPYYVTGRGVRIQFTDCTFGGYGYLPSADLSISMVRGSNGAFGVEIDKLIHNFYTVETQYTAVQYQSECVNSIFDGCTLTRNFNGTGGDFLFQNGVIGSTGGQSIKVGCTGSYGITRSCTIRDTEIEGTIVPHIHVQAMSDFENLGNGLLRNASIPGTVTNLGREGAWGFIGSSDGEYYGSTFQITSIYGVGETVDHHVEYVYYQTTLPDVFPTLTGKTATHFNVIPCLRLSVYGCTGSADALSLSNAPKNRPIGEYNERLVYSSDWTWYNNGPIVYQIGQLIDIQIDVRRIYTGANATQLMHFGFAALNESYSLVYVEFDVDLKQLGIRTITPATITGSQGADSLGSPPGDVKLCFNVTTGGTPTDPGDTQEQQAQIFFRVRTDTGVVLPVTEENTYIVLTM